jgi:hypothetical protein
MEGLAAMSLSKGGALETAVALWQRQYEESSRADLRDNARNHLISFQVARELWRLESLVAGFKAKTGAYPRSLEELVRAETRPCRIADPSGTPYQYDPRSGAVGLSPETKVRYLAIPEDLKEQLENMRDP